jgi:hypothetical protein
LIVTLEIAVTAAITPFMAGDCRNKSGAPPPHFQTQPQFNPHHALCVLERGGSAPLFDFRSVSNLQQ